MGETDKELNQNLKYTALAIRVIKDLDKARENGIKKLRNKQVRTGENVTLFTPETIRKYALKNKKAMVQETDNELDR